jgi:hypothetical protein
MVYGVVAADLGHGTATFLIIHAIAASAAGVPADAKPANAKLMVVRIINGGKTTIRVSCIPGSFLAPSATLYLLHVTDMRIYEPNRA